MATTPRRLQNSTEENRDDPKDFLFMHFRLLTQRVCHKVKIMKVFIFAEDRDSAVYQSDYRE
jgi:hypothetical protein